MLYYLLTNKEELDVRVKKRKVKNENVSKKLFSEKKEAINLVISKFSN